jgi:hypothetical protein
VHLEERESNAREGSAGAGVCNAAYQPAYPPGPYRFIDREYLSITYRTDPAKVRAVAPEPLEFDERESLVKYEFIRMPNSPGFGDYTETGQVIPVSLRGRKGGYTQADRRGWPRAGERHRDRARGVGARVLIVFSMAATRAIASFLLTLAGD